MKIINNADREIHFLVVGAGSKTLWEGDVSQGASTEKSIPQSIYYLTTTFKVDPPLVGDTFGSAPNQKITDESTVIVSQVYCGAIYNWGPAEGT
jgi:hypothetical protein